MDICRNFSSLILAGDCRNRKLVKDVIWHEYMGKIKLLVVAIHCRYLRLWTDVLKSLSSFFFECVKIEDIAANIKHLNLSSCYLD